MSAITHARKRVYPQVWDLAPVVRDTFENLLEAAAETVDNATFFALHRAAAQAAGLRLPASGEWAVCTCRCGCQRIHDGYHSAVYAHGNGTETVQCPDCHEDHRITD